MNCFICDRDRFDVMLLRLPVEGIYENGWVEIIGNNSPNEHICLPCMAYQIEEADGRIFRVK